MRILLRLFSIVTALAVLGTVLLMYHFASMGWLGEFLRHGVLGTATAICWGATLLVGPVAAVQLWRLKLGGLVATTGLVALALVYYVGGALAFGMNKGLATAILFNGVALVILLMPSARRACSDAQPSTR
jgi:hypothetical protein